MNLGIDFGFDTTKWCYFWSVWVWIFGVNYAKMWCLWVVLVLIIDVLIVPNPKNGLEMGFWFFIFLEFFYLLLLSSAICVICVFFFFFFFLLLYKFLFLFLFFVH